jgi:DNA-binding response OmpR family regulator
LPAQLVDPGRLEPVASQAHRRTPRRSPAMLGVKGAAQAAPAVKRILIADDEPSVRLLLRVNLPLGGFDVVEANDGEAALRAARAGRFDLILLDVMMPGVDGFDVARQLREDPATRNVPIVFLSARADAADIDRGLEIGAVEYITKPFDPLRLGERLLGLLEQTERGRATEPRGAGPLADDHPPA